MLKRVASSVSVFLIALLALTVQADDVSISNPSSKPVQFRVKVPSTGYDKIVTLQPGETQNAIGTDLWHNALVVIIGLDSNPDHRCGLVINETSYFTDLFGRRFLYLPQILHIKGYRACPYSSNFPHGCDCGNLVGQSDQCQAECLAITNAQVIVQH